MARVTRFAGDAADHEAFQLYDRVRAVETAQNPSAGFPMPYVLANAATAIPLTSGSYTSVSLTLESEGYGFAMSSGAILVPFTGVYQVNFATAFAAASSNGGFSNLYQNGSQVAQGSSCGFSGDPGRQSVGSKLLLCTDGDLIALYGYQNTGSSLAVESGPNRTYVEMFLVGPQ